LRLTNVFLKSPEISPCPGLRPQKGNEDAIRNDGSPRHIEGSNIHKAEVEARDAVEDDVTRFPQQQVTRNHAERSINDGQHLLKRPLALGLLWLSKVHAQLVCGIKASYEVVKELGDRAEPVQRDVLKLEEQRHGADVRGAARSLKLAGKLRSLLELIADASELERFKRTTNQHQDQRCDGHGANSPEALTGCKT
jgi:hypothetical protein